MSLFKSVPSDVAITAPKLLKEAAKVPEKRLNVRLDGDKYQKFYDLCFEHRKSMKEVIEAHIDDCLKRGTL